MNCRTFSQNPRTRGKTLPKATIFWPPVSVIQCVSPTEFDTARGAERPVSEITPPPPKKTSKECRETLKEHKRKKC